MDKYHQVCSISWNFYVKLTPELANSKKGIINIHSSDNDCFRCETFKLGFMTKTDNSKTEVQNSTLVRPFHERHAFACAHTHTHASV